MYPLKPTENYRSIAKEENLYVQGTSNGIVSNVLISLNVQRIYDFLLTPRPC